MPNPTPHRCALVLAAVIPAFCHAADLRFDVATFNATPEGSTDHMNQVLFNVLNFNDANGHYMAMGSDAHRPEIESFGNTLAAYYNSWTTLYNNQSVKDGNLAADAINNYVTSGFQKVGSKTRPTWVVLNELSGSLWPSNATYRQWTIDTVTRLHDVYGYEVIAYSPFPNPVNNAPDWQLLSAKSYIGIEYYLSGAEVKNMNYDLAAVQAAYQSAKDSYLARGVPVSKMILGEEFASTVAGNGYGRDGVSQAEWEQTIRVRSQAIYNVGFTGFIGYAWGKNGMMLSDAELLAAEAVYRSTMVLQSEKPQWIATTGGSWGTRNNWMAVSTIPDAPGAAANFERTTLAAATVTLDGDRTVGTLSFNSPSGVTITAGAGGTLTFDNLAAQPAITVSAGSHHIAAPLGFASPATLAISPGARLDITESTLVLDPATAVRQYLLFNQLTSSTPDPGGLTSLGYFNTGDSILVRLTYTGDADLDGKVTPDDYARLDRGYAKHLSTWQDGDFNYDGIINNQDYALIDRLFVQQGNPPSPDFLAARASQFGADYVAALLTSIPEPAHLLIFLHACGFLFTRRRARH